MWVAFGRGARRELAMVVLVAVAGIALASLVAFAPWYEPGTLPDAVPVLPEAQPADTLVRQLIALFR
jgi:hypothetical protein